MRGARRDARATLLTPHLNGAHLTCSERATLTPLFVCVMLLLCVRLRPRFGVLMNELQHSPDALLMPLVRATPERSLRHGCVGGTLWRGPEPLHVVDGWRCSPFCSSSVHAAHVDGVGRSPSATSWLTWWWQSTTALSPTSLCGSSASCVVSRVLHSTLRARKTTSRVLWPSARARARVCVCVCVRARVCVWSLLCLPWYDHIQPPTRGAVFVLRTHAGTWPCRLPSRRPRPW